MSCKPCLHMQVVLQDKQATDVLQGDKQKLLECMLALQADAVHCLTMEAAYYISGVSVQRAGRL